MRPRWVVLGAVVALCAGADLAVKLWALSALRPGQTEHAWGGLLKLTLSFNKGAAFGVHLGEASRPLFICFSLFVLGWLLWIYGRTPRIGRLRAAGVSLVCAGALGNLIDRIFWSRGVVDFIGPYDLGFMVWPIFNVADCYVVVGIACLLASMRHGDRLVTQEAGWRAEDRCL